MITPARNEAENLRRLGESLAQQDVPPAAWIVVDNGSDDGSVEVVERFRRDNEWTHVLQIGALSSIHRGGPSVRAFHAGLHDAGSARFIANVDADISFESDYFSQILEAFDAEPRLGIASGACLELQEGRWSPRRVTGDTVWGGARVYRASCLDELLPLEERMSWDSLSQLKANALGWTTRILPGLWFRHHRPEGGRDGGRFRSRAIEGRSAHYMGYRSWYLGLRAGHHVLRGEMGALGLVWGYARAAAEREPRCADPHVRAALELHQDPWALMKRIREATGIGTRRTRREDPPPAEEEMREPGGEASGNPRKLGPADVLLVCSTGGHLLQLHALAGAWNERSRLWVTFDKSDARSLLVGERVVPAYGPTNRNLGNLLRNLRLAYSVIRRTRPRVMVTTGAGVAVPFAWVARAFGARVVYVESMARIDGPSLTLRLTRHAANDVFVQWPELADALPWARYSGQVFEAS